MPVATGSGPVDREHPGRRHHDVDGPVVRLDGQRPVHQLVVVQALVGTVQFFTGVPAALVAIHVAGAAACTAATAALWASMRERAKPEALEGGLNA